MLICTAYGVSIHAPPEGRDLAVVDVHAVVVSVSIHAPPEGRDFNPLTTGGIAPRFQSTRPRRGAIILISFSGRNYEVSIHAPPEGRDHPCLEHHCTDASFNPRAPGGARLAAGNDEITITVFQSTRPRRGAIYLALRSQLKGFVSIHAPPEGRDMQV